MSKPSLVIKSLWNRSDRAQKILSPDNKQDFHHDIKADGLFKHLTVDFGVVLHHL